MFASIKFANVAHLAALKIAATKSVVGVGILVGSAATGLVVTESLEPDYLSGAAALIKQAVDTEAGIPDNDHVGGGHIRNHSDARVDFIPATGSGMAQVIITGHRMNQNEKLAYDREIGDQMLASTAHP